MTLEEDETASLYKSQLVIHLKKGVNKMFVFMSPLILAVTWFIYKNSDETPGIWIYAISVPIMMYLSLRLIIHSASSKSKWIIKGGKIIPKGQISHKLDPSSVITTKQISNLEGYYELRADRLSIILKECEFPKEEVVQAFEKEIPTQ